MKTHLMLHHSATEDSASVSWQAIRRFHVEHNGWRAIGYHLGIERVNGEYEALLGRPFHEHAAAAYQQGMNRKAIHVCFVGNFDAAAPDPLMLDFARPHLVALLEAYDIPIENVIGHSTVAPKTCPGRLFPLDEYRRSLIGA